MNANLRQEMNNCDECIRLKMEDIIPCCCQYHLDKQFED
jgi:hypothetical protein